MTESAWTAFSAARERYRQYIAELDASLPGLRKIQQQLADDRGGRPFTVETPVVYNRALDDVEIDDDIKMILVADNPGAREQAAENRRYLVGPSGKLADGFFRAYPELAIDFRKNVLILNKTPIHTPRTAELKILAREGGEEILRAIRDSQTVMVDLIQAFHRAIRSAASASPQVVPLWIIGYSELGKGKLFESFREALTAAYSPNDGLRSSILLFRHFSMNQFSADVKRRRGAGESMGNALFRIGSEYRQRVLGW